LLTIEPTIPNWADSMYDEPGRQAVTASDFCIPGVTPAKQAALLQQLRSCRIMDGTIHPSSTQQRRISGVDDGIDSQFGDVSLMCF